MNSITAQRAREFDIEPQQENESDSAFRCRVSGMLREAGHLIEAHEAFQNALYDQSDDVMTGIFGAVAMAMQGVNYSSDGMHQVGDDIAAGTVAQHPQDDDAAKLAMLAIVLGL